MIPALDHDAPHRPRVKHEPNAVAADKLIRREADSWQARPCRRTRVLELETKWQGKDQARWPKRGPQVCHAPCEADDVKIQKQSGSDRAGDGLVVAHRDGVDARRSRRVSLRLSAASATVVYGREWFTAHRAASLFWGVHAPAVTLMKFLALSQCQRVTRSCVQSLQSDYARQAASRQLETQPCHRPSGQ